MKQVLFLFISLLMISCSKNPVPKPDNLLDDEVMVDIIYDISILQATDGSMPQKLIENDIKMDQYIFEKYKKIYKKVLERLDQEKANIQDQVDNSKDIGGAKPIYVPSE